MDYIIFFNVIKELFTKSLLRSINKKNKLYRQYLRQRSNEKLLKYKTYKNKLTNLLRVAKRLYFQNQIEINKTNIKQTWRILNNAIGQNKKKKLTYPLVDENGESITSTEKVANKFWLQVNLFLQICKFLMFLVSTRSK